MTHNKIGEKSTMTTTLDTETVINMFTECLDDHIDGPNTVVVEGILHKAAFEKSRLAEHRHEIGSLLEQLPSDFQPTAKGGGGGMSFLNACNDRDGNQWTSFHQVMEQLFMLGIASGQAQWCLPREMWDVLPGAMPYVAVVDDETNIESV